MVSDILQNSTSSRPAAWTCAPCDGVHWACRYRREFEKSLPDIFEQFEVGLQRSESKLEISRAKEQAPMAYGLWPMAVGLWPMAYEAVSCR